MLTHIIIISYIHFDSLNLKVFCNLNTKLTFLYKNKIKQISHGISETSC